MAGAALRLPLIFAAATIAAGVLDSFLPLVKGIPSNLTSAALLVQAVTATLSRWQAGRHGDRYGHARLLIPALAVAAAGLAAMVMLGSPVVLFASMVLFGAGFGVIENATFALLIEQLPEARASALWNLAYDAGYGAGPAVFGLVCAAHRLPGGVRPDRRADPHRSPGRRARAEGRGQHGAAGVTSAATPGTGLLSPAGHGRAVPPWQGAAVGRLPG